MSDTPTPTSCLCPHCPDDCQCDEGRLSALRAEVARLTQERDMARADNKRCRMAYTRRYKVLRAMNAASKAELARVEDDLCEAREWLSIERHDNTRLDDENIRLTQENATLRAAQTVPAAGRSDLVGDSSSN